MKIEMDYWKMDKRMGAGFRISVLIWGGGTWGRGGTQNPYIYNTNKNSK